MKPKTDAELRAMHTCMRSMSSMSCTACNRGIAYPHEPVEEFTERMRSAKKARCTPGYKTHLWKLAGAGATKSPVCARCNCCVGVRDLLAAYAKLHGDELA